MTRSMTRALTRTLTHRLHYAQQFLRDHVNVSRRDTERGDIPGWVMVVLMTAAIVAAVWALAEPALTRLFNDAIDEVAR